VLCVPIDLHNLLAAMQGDAVSLIPGIVMDQDIFVSLLAGQNGREHDAIVVDARLSAKNGDFVSVRRTTE
jgi:hypothetical protein